MVPTPGGAMHVKADGLVLGLLGGMPQPHPRDFGRHDAAEFLRIVQQRVGRHRGEMLERAGQRQTEGARHSPQHPEGGHGHALGAAAIGIVARQHGIAGQVDLVVHGFLVDEAAHLLAQERIGDLVLVGAHRGDEEPLGRGKAERRGIEHRLERSAGRKPRAGRDGIEIDVDLAANDRRASGMHRPRLTRPPAPRQPLRPLQSRHAHPSRRRHR